MSQKKRLQLSLFLLRVSIFVVMLVWTADKLLRPDHAAIVYETFYFLGGLQSTVVYGIGILELALILGFLFGIWKTFTYGLVLLLHGISTFSSFYQYIHPFEGANILFFAAWPMLAGCIALFLLRKEDCIMTI